MPRTTDHKPRTGFTLVEMLVAMAITLVMIGAVVTLFANVSNSVRNRRAVIELSGQVRHVRNMLQRDLEGATCTGLTWQRPEHNRGYIEIIEGAYREGNASMLTDGNPDSDGDGNPDPDELDPGLSIIPRNNAVRDYNGNGRIDDDDRRVHLQRADSLVGENNVGANGLGDHDDVLMLTVRNEHEPFVGKVPAGVRPDDADADVFSDWTYETVESPLAEVVWYAIENPTEADNADGFFGEPGMRTVYRRALLIAPWINPYRFVESNGVIHDMFQIDGSGPIFRAQPGLVRIFPDDVERDEPYEALAGLIAFQDRYDLSVRLEFDPLLDPTGSGGGGRWKIVANTLGDLTKRENRYEHHFLRPVAGQGRAAGREYPYALMSVGFGYSGSDPDVVFVPDPEIGGPATSAAATANLVNLFGLGQYVASYAIDPANLNNASRRYEARPFAYVEAESTTVATARAMLNDEGEVVRVVHGLVPLWGTRRGEDVMLTDVLAFDLRVYDPGAPLFGVRDDPTDSTSPVGTILEPSDPGWYAAYNSPDNMNDTGSGPTGEIGTGTALFPFVGQGAYVDLGYRTSPGLLIGPSPPIFASGIPHIDPWFFNFETLSDVYLRSRPDNGRIYSQLAPGYAVYDTWPFHYENNGLNEDEWRWDETGSIWLELPEELGLVDEGTNGLDDPGSYSDTYLFGVENPRLGPDDVGERETAPPYDQPLRGVQVVVRAYERDSRQIRQVTVNQNFVPE